MTNKILNEVYVSPQGAIYLIEDETYWENLVGITGPICGLRSSQCHETYYTAGTVKELIEFYKLEYVGEL